jgi:hypothetical protein
MELPGSDYFYALATVAITFVGFSALLLFFRQTLGGGLTKYDAYFTLSFIQPGFIVTGGALLPPLLALCGFDRDDVWRVSSALTAVMIVLFVATVPARRHAAVDEPVPVYVAALLALQALGALVLVANAIGQPLAPGPGLHAAAVTWLLFTTAIAYLRALAISIHRPLTRAHGSAHE